MRSPSTTIGCGGGDQRMDARGGHYWSLDGVGGDCDDATDDDVAAERALPGRVAPTDRSSGRVAETANVEASSDR